jgi:NitT/TauT family transport system substrate-binding protein
MPSLLPVKMALNTFYSGPQAWFFLADDLGYFRDEGIDMSFSPGDTAANVVPRLGDASLGFDCGYGDVNALIEWSARHGSACAKVVYCLHNASPYTIAVPAQSSVKHLKDLAGKRVVSHPNDAALKMLPELALRTGLVLKSADVELCSEPHPSMVTDMVVNQRWDAMFGFVNTLKSAALEKNIDPAALRFFEYRDLLPELYGAGLMVSTTFLAEHRDRIQGLVRAVNRGLAACINDIDAAIDAVARRDPAIDKPANKARLLGTLALEMAHVEGGKHGIGFMDEERVNQAIALMVEAKGFAHVPSSSQIFTTEFLPAHSERIKSLIRSNSSCEPTNLVSHQSL